mgnify:CR=1 FL=1
MSVIGVMLIVRPHTMFIANDGELNILGIPYTHEERVLGVIICLIQSILLSVNILLIKVMGGN